MFFILDKVEKKTLERREGVGWLPFKEDMIDAKAGWYCKWDSSWRNGMNSSGAWLIICWYQSLLSTLIALYWREYARKSTKYGSDNSFRISKNDEESTF